MDEGFLISGRMLRDHLLTAVNAGLEGAIQRSQGGSGIPHGNDSDDSDATPSTVVRLCLCCQPRTAAAKARKIHKRHKRQIKDGGQTTQTGQVAHLSSAVDK